MQQRIVVLIVCIAFLAVTWADDAGLITRESSFDVKETVDRIIKLIEDRYPPINVALAFDHQKNAHEVGLDMPPTTTLFFGNPSLGTLFMQVDQRIGIDLPLHVLVWEEHGKVLVAYNDPFEYLRARYRIVGKDPQFTTMNDTLAAIVEFAIGNEKGQVSQVSKRRTKSLVPGLIEKKSAHSVKETLNRLEALFEGTPIDAYLRVDHQAAASGVGLQLRPTEVIMFGNPVLGTPLMLNDRRLGNDLPTKVLCWQDASGDVWLEYTDIFFYKDRYHMIGDDEIFAMLATAIDNLTSKAVAPDA